MCGIVEIAKAVFWWYSKYHICVRLVYKYIHFMCGIVEIAKTTEVPTILAKDSLPTKSERANGIICWFWNLY